ncbi:hypothetical protein ACJ41O_005681 [Fusarium nematophilum]
MKPTPLVLLSLSVLAGAGPMPEGFHPIRDNAGQALVAAANAGEARSVLDSSGKSANSRRKARVLGAQNRRARRRQRRFRRDDEWTENDDTDTEDEQQPAPVSTPAAAPKPDHGDDGYYTDNDGHYTSCDEYPEREKCTKRLHVQTTQKPVPATTTRVKPAQPKPTTPNEPWTDTDNPDWETDCDSYLTDDGEYERCKTKTKVPAARTTAVNKVPTATDQPVTTAQPYQDDTDNPDHLTDCDTDWSDDGEHERCKTKVGAITRTTVNNIPAPTITTARPYNDDTDNPDYLTDCDSDWTDDGERERCRTKVVSVATTAADAAGTGAPNEPVEVTNGGAGQADGVKHAVAMAGLVAAAALAF